MSPRGFKTDTSDSAALGCIDLFDETMEAHIPFMYASFALQDYQTIKEHEQQNFFVWRLMSLREPTADIWSLGCG